LEVHGVAGAGFIGGVGSEESVGEASLTLFIFTIRTIFQPSTNVGFHGRPKVMACQGGMDFSVGEVVEIGVMLAGEGFAEGKWNQDARGEIRIPVDVETVARGERVGVDRSKAIRVASWADFQSWRDEGSVVSRVVEENESKGRERSKTWAKIWEKSESSGTLPINHKSLSPGT
jgi:hypothetical protein